MALTDKLSAIADAIRAKTGKTDGLTLEQMPAEIASIETGGGSAEGCVTVTFMNGDVELFSRPVYIGDDCPNPVDQNRIDTPTKESTAQYNYVFYGWGASDGGAADSNILKNITEDKTVYAVYTATVRSYTITYQDEDGTELYSKDWTYGSIPSYTPVKSGYEFIGWTPTLSAVTGDATYTAQWEQLGWKWDLTDGVLTISGSGEMDDYSLTGAPWYSQAGSINSIVIGDKITHIGEAAFFNCKATSVQFGAGVTSIGEYAFQSCTSLPSIDIPDSVTYLGPTAFKSCIGATSINIGSGVTVIPDNAFYNCYSLTSVTIHSGIAEIKDQAFYKCTSLVSAIFENPNGWSVYYRESEGGQKIATLTSSNMSNAATAAKYLTTDHFTRVFKRT